MFRKLRKKEISLDAINNLLNNSKRAVLALNGDDGYPYAIPINYYYDENNQKIYFHGSSLGHKGDSLKRSDKVCLTIYGSDTYKDESWAPYVESVVIFGRCHMIETTPASLAIFKKLVMKFFPSKEMATEVIKKAQNNIQLYEIDIEHLSGKVIQEK